MKKIALVCLLAAGLVQAKLADNFQVIANEKEVVVDEVSGRDVVFLTSAEHMNSTQYPHNKGWLEDSKYVMFESSRPRPDGTDNGGTFPNYQDGERQLLAADVESGDIYHLATLEMEDTAQYGKYHLGMSSQYHTDYAPDTNVVVYYDMTGHNLYILDLDNGYRKKIWNCDMGTIGDPPSITDDGTRLLVYVAHPGPDHNDYLAGRTTAVYSFDLDPKTNEVLSGPKVVLTWTHRTEETYPNSTNGINLTHPVINPANKEEMSYCHGYPGYSDGSVEKSRIWYARTDGSLNKLVLPTPEGRIHTHELWGPKGRFIYFINIKGSGGISVVDPETGKSKDLISGISPRCLHLTVSADETKFAFDTQRFHNDAPLDEYQNHKEDVVLFERTTGKTTVLAHQLEGLHHPRQMHPGINRAGDMVYFTVGAGPCSRAAYVRAD